jgi:hypothetical protein
MMAIGSMALERLDLHVYVCRKISEQTLYEVARLKRLVHLKLEANPSVRGFLGRALLSA